MAGSFSRMVHASGNKNSMVTDFPALRLVSVAYDWKAFVLALNTREKKLRNKTIMNF